MFSAANRNFYRLRLRNTSLAELIYRAKQLLLIWRLKRKFAASGHQAIAIPKSEHYKKLNLPSLQCKVTKEGITDFLDGRIFTLNSDPAALKRIENEMAGIFFSSIDWEKEHYDIRMIWEPARLQNIATMLAYINDNHDNPVSKKIGQFCANKIISWINKNPFLSGPHYLSAMECGLRISVLFYSIKLLDNLQHKQIRIILETIYMHAWWISKRLSLYSSTGNHTIAEGVGLIFAGAIFFEEKECRDWQKKGIRILEQELSHQILEDGGPAEQSFHYHRFVLDLYWLATNFLGINHLYDCGKLQARLLLAEKFLLAFQDKDGRMPSIGDSDDGFAIAPNIRPPKPNIILEKKNIRIFKDSGYTVIRTDRQVQLIFDHGPLGMPPLYNHGHADALSITLNKGGKQILVDSGTYQYNGAPGWRRYFKGTKAHNTICVDGLDQAVQETEFIWSRPYRVKFLEFSEKEGRCLIKAMHDGYARLKEPVRHKRALLYFDDSCFLIRDSFMGIGIHDIEINFHLHPDVQLTQQNRWWQINNNGACVYMRLLENDDFSPIRGINRPIYGWYSPRYGTKMKSTVLRQRKTGVPGEIRFTTIICADAIMNSKHIQDRLAHFD